jgi:hypothetical protein
MTRKALNRMNKMYWCVQLRGLFPLRFCTCQVGERLAPEERSCRFAERVALLEDG